MCSAEQTSQLRRVDGDLVIGGGYREDTGAESYVMNS